VIDRERLVETLERAAASGLEVYAPVTEDCGVMLSKVGDAGRLSFDHVLTVNTLKDILLPGCEVLARFNVEEQTLSAVPDEGGRILIFGCRPCDAAALDILDAILLGEQPDEAYGRRRNRSVVVTVGCSAFDQACFCTSMGFGPHDATGSDVLLLPKEGSYLVRSLTPKGRALLDELELEEDADGEPDAPPEVDSDVDLQGLKEWLDDNFSSARWKEISELCVGCGVCSYLCPTCHCYDITDEAGASRGLRLRTWDCCAFSGFTRMATHQPRVGTHARYRQRIMHKFSHCVDNVGKTACVGDGRCIRFCPFGIDIREVLENLRKER
jgi:ferredoxin